MKNLNLL